MGFVENVNIVAGNVVNVNKVATDIDNVGIVADDIVNINIVANDKVSIDTVAEGIVAVDNVSINMDEIKKLNEIHDLGQLPLINDTTPSTIDAYSSAKTQAMHDTQQEALSNLSSCSGSLYATGAYLNITTSNQNLTFSPSIATTNDMLFVIGTDEIVVKANGTYNFTSVIEVGLNTTGTRVITFEVYDKNSLAVISTTVSSINGSNGNILQIPLNTLMQVETVPYGGSITLKIRVKADIGTGDVVLRDFSSTLVLSGSASGGGQLLGKDAVKAVGYLAQSTKETLVIPEWTNGYSIGEVVLENGASITVPNGSIYKVI